VTRRGPGTEAAETRPRGTGRGVWGFETAGAPSGVEEEGGVYGFCALLQREILSASLLRLPVGSARNRRAACTSVSVQPVLRWISSIAWILRVVYSLQSNTETSFGFEIQIHSVSRA
jgi:hypothetical protein